MKKHIDLAHKGRQGGKKYQCIQCAEEFDEIQSHKQHMENHIQEKPFKCQRCGLHLTNASGLKRHIRRVSYILDFVLTSTPSLYNEMGTFRLQTLYKVYICTMRFT